MSQANNHSGKQIATIFGHVSDKGNSRLQSNELKINGHIYLMTCRSSSSSERPTNQPTNTRNCFRLFN
ncbi:hypothetical protein DERP_000217 [Dermatophagoides pteronyssinus]|uniref:Uncharacterized protein n=1 Tax=Dermatophagoides pteronyssinus TaxID=6956 RepID=A0ABQ8IZI7_DERPT|nr:hypothetical protein DERP_000217 [Dermatophagoides pteronyssinus]